VNYILNEEGRKMNFIKVSRSQLASIDNFLRQGLKIDAIKFIRETDRQPPPPGHSYGFTSIGLKEAKDAAERRWNALGMIPEIDLSATNNTRLTPTNPIKRIVVEMGDGEVELDMEGVSLKFLSGLTTVGLSEVAALCDLYKRIKDWEDNNEQ